MRRYKQRVGRGCLAFPACVFLAGCTALEWRGADGVDRHVGLVAIRTVQGSAGQEVWRYSFGVDWRFSGPEPGVSLGWKRIALAIPEVRQVASLPSLGDQVERLLAGGGELPKASTSWQWFLAQDSPRAGEATSVASRLFGLELALADTEGAMGIGYADRCRLTARAVNDPCVELQLRDPEDPSRFQHFRWLVTRARP